jgi:energy-converting hydrogenase A subunit M
MQHRHLNHEGYTLAALDDVIERGKREDWAQLRSAALRDTVLMEKILRVALAHANDRYAQRYHFWRRYAEQRLDAV